MNPFFHRLFRRLFAALAGLILLGSPVYAADSISFVIGGHRVHIEAPRHCNSASCLSISIPGVYQKRARDRDDDDYDKTASVPPAAPVPVVPPAVTPKAAPAVCAPPASPIQSNVSTLQEAVATEPPQPRLQPPQPLPPQPQPPLAPPPQIQQATTTVVAPPPSPVVARPAEIISPAPKPASRVSKVSHEVDEEPEDTPIGDWQTHDAKGMVRIEPCGQALCGYVLDPLSNAKGETVLVDMKSKSATEWSGNIYSRDSGNIYYSKISMKGPNALNVEACALGRFFCSGTIWRRIDIKPARLVTDRSLSQPPRS